jgi:hypothetical protein
MGQPAENKPRTKPPSAQLSEEPIAAVDLWRGAPVSLRAQQNEIGPKLPFQSTPANGSFPKLNGLTV